MVCFKRIILIITTFFVLISPAFADLTIVNKGTSDYEIVVAQNDFPITVRAAEDLQQYINKSTGVSLPIVRKDTIGAKPAIVIGEGAAKSLGVSLDGVKTEGFRIKTVGKNVVIAGRDTDGDPGLINHGSRVAQAGSWSGVAQFLKKELGVRWFMPGEEGEYVPNVGKLVVKDQDYKDAPVMIYRAMTYLTFPKTSNQRRTEVSEWLRRNGGGWSISWSGSHTWEAHFSAKKYYDSHPEWFALVDGIRFKDSALGAQMCTTNPEALDEFARVIIEWGKKNPGMMFSLSPNDGGGFCECDNCRALDRKKFEDGMPILSDRIYTYANEVAKRVNKELPDQKFGIYSYVFFADPPTYVKLDPHVYVMGVLNDSLSYYRSKEYQDYHLNQRLLPWSKITDNQFSYTHPSGTGNMDLPGMEERVLKVLFNNLGEAGVKGVMLCNRDSFASTGLNYYLDISLAWNPKLDVDAIYADALKKCYGEKSAPFVQKYFDIVEDGWQEFCDKHITQKYWMKGYGFSIYPVALDEIYNGLYESAMPLLKKAMTLTDDKGQQARVKLLMDNLEYTRMTVDIYNLSKKVMGGNGTKEEILKARDLAKTRLDYYTANQQTNLFGDLQTGLLDVQQGWALSFTNPQVYDYLLMKSMGDKSTVNIDKVQTPPVLDGDLSDPAWQGAQELQVNLRKDDASKSDISAVAKLVCDSKNIYLGIRCAEPRISEIADTVTTHRGEVWSDNEVEVFFDAANSKKAFRQIMVNTLGAVNDMKSDGGDPVPWDSGVKVAVKKNTDSWAVEMAVPISSITQDEVNGGDIWGLNICRTRILGSIHEYTCWSPTFGGFLQPDRFGNLVFK